MILFIFCLIVLANTTVSVHGMTHGTKSLTRPLLTQEEQQSQADKQQLDKKAYDSQLRDQFDNDLAVVTTAPELQKLIRAYAIDSAEFPQALHYAQSYHKNSNNGDPFKQIIINNDATMVVAHNRSERITILNKDGTARNASCPFYNPEIEELDRRSCATKVCTYGGLCSLCECTGGALLAGKSLLAESCIYCVGGTGLGFSLICCGLISPVYYCCYINSKSSLCQPKSMCCCCCPGYTDSLRFPTTRLALHPNGTIVAASKIDNYHCQSPCPQTTHMLEIWGRNGRLQQSFVAHTDTITALAIAPNGTIVTGSNDMFVKLWKGDVPPILLLGHRAPIKTVTIQNTIVATADTENTIKIWDHQGRCIKTIDYASFPIAIIKLFEDGTLLIAQSRIDSETKKNADLITHYNQKNAQIIKELTFPSEYYDVTAFEELYDETIIIATKSGHLLSWKPDGTTAELFEHYDSIISLSVLKNGTIAMGCRDGTIQFLIPPVKATQLLSRCTLQQLAFIQKLAKLSEKNPQTRIPLSRESSQLFLSLPTSIRTSLQHNCPQITLEK